MNLLDNFRERKTFLIKTVIGVGINMSLAMSIIIKIVSNMAVQLLESNIIIICDYSCY